MRAQKPAVQGATAQSYHGSVVLQGHAPPVVCERLARSETSMLSGVTWRHHIGTLNPDPELIANHARAAIRSWTGLTEAGSTRFYVGVSRYLRRRWLGGDNLSF